MSVTVYDVGEYNLLLEMPTDNFVAQRFDSIHSEHIDLYIDKIYKSIQNSDQLVLLMGLFSNLQERPHWVDPLNSLADSVTNRVVVLNGNLSPFDGTTKFHYHKMTIFDHISNIFWQENLEREPYDWATINIDRKHKFYWASTKDWYPRRYVLSQLIKNKLLEGNLVNYKCLMTNIPSDYLDIRFDDQHRGVIQYECNSIQHLLPLPYLDNTIEFNQTNRDFYLDSYLGIITDTFYDNDIFLSEKVFNAMHYYQLFIYLGPAHTLRYLRDQGYMTFGDIIDESYDEIKDHAERLMAFTQSLTDFLNLPMDKMKQAYIKSIPKLKHNKTLLDTQRSDQTFTKFMQDAIR